jgi:hypothetical protein
MRSGIFCLLISGFGLLKAWLAQLESGGCVGKDGGRWGSVDASAVADLATWLRARSLDDETDEQVRGSTVVGNRADMQVDKKVRSGAPASCKMLQSSSHVETAVETLTVTREGGKLWAPGFRRSFLNEMNLDVQDALSLPAHASSSARRPNRVQATKAGRYLRTVYL